MGIRRVMVRYDTEDLAAVEKFRVESGLDTESAAMRTLLKLGLTVGQEIDPVWRAAITREVAKNVYGTLHESVTTALNDTLNRILESSK